MHDVLSSFQAYIDRYDLLFVKLVVQVAFTAMIASLLLRFKRFANLLLREPLSSTDRIEFGMVLGVIAATGAWARINLGYASTDLLVVAPLLSGFMVGVTAGFWTGVLGGLVPLRHGEWLSPIVGTIIGIGAGLTRASLKDPASIWLFSPVPFGNTIVSWRRWRAEKVVDPRLLMMLVASACEIFRTECARWTDAKWLFSYEPAGPLTYYAVVLTCLTCFGISLKIWNTPRLEAKIRKQEALLAEARLDALRDQINPHFLFNTLNTINSLVRVHPDQARSMIVKLSAILRRLLYSRDNTCSLKAELDFVEDYLNIERVRFGAERLKVEREIAPEVMDARVPMMLLQPIVENAIKHGIGRRLRGGIIKIKAAAEGGVLVIDVEDDGVGMSAAALSESLGRGIGLRNVRERLESLHGTAAKLEVESAPGVGTNVRVKFPYHLTEDETWSLGA